MAEVDVALYGGVTPPVFVPVSDRAKTHLDLPDGVDGVIILGAPLQAICVFPPDYVMGSTEDIPHNVVITGVDPLH